VRVQAVSIDLSISASMCACACVCGKQSQRERESLPAVCEADVLVVASLVSVYASVVCRCETRTASLSTYQ